jgi:hypothetical protein
MKIDKEKVEVIIYLSNCKIEGTVHIPQGGRLTDFINVPNKNFIPVTDAKITSIDKTNQFAYNVNLVQINKNFIQTLFPRSAVSSDIEDFK